MSSDEKQLKRFSKLLLCFQRVGGGILSRKSAVIAYYAIFSMPGLLVLVISIAHSFFKRDVITGYLTLNISSIMGVNEEYSGYDHQRQPGQINHC